MNDARFEALVAKLEAEAARNPARYRLRVIVLAALGYAYLVVALILLSVVFIGLLVSIVFLKYIAIKIAIPVGAFLLMVVKSIWVKLSPPAGYPLSRGQAPDLYAMIDAIGAELRSPPFHSVVIDGELNAAVVQVPRLGIFGFHRNYLLIGLPLMKALTREQFKAVLAHEFGHLAGGHAKISNWIYRLRLSWMRLSEVLQANRHKGSFLFLPFINRYAPFFSAYSFPLARRNEYEADACSVRVTSPLAAAEALSNVRVFGTYFHERFWPELHRQADEVPNPAFMPYSRMGDFHDAVAPGAQKWLGTALSAQTTIADTHPSLASRLEAIGQPARFSPPPPGAGAEVLLGDALPAVTRYLDEAWHAAILPHWERRHAEVQEGRKRLAALEARARDEVLPIGDALQHARLIEAFGAGAAAALELFRTLCARAPGNNEATLALGIRLLALDDETGVALVARAIEAEENYLLEGCDALQAYFSRAGNAAETEKWRVRWLERARQLQAAREERNIWHLKDALEPAGLPDAELAELQRQLSAVSGIRKAYLVRKTVRLLPQHACYLLGFTSTPWWKRHSKRRAAEVEARITANVTPPEGTVVFNVEGPLYKFERRMRRIRGSRIL